MTRLSIPFQAWPDPDREAWLAATTRGSLFKSGGRAACWAPATAKEVLKNYARWLGFLAAEDLDFQEYDSNPRLDREVDILCSRYGSDYRRIESRLEELQKKSIQAQSRRCEAMNSFVSRQGAAETRPRKRASQRRDTPKRRGRLWSLNQVSLSQGLVAHEEANRLAKMRFLRDVSVLIQHLGLEPYQAGLLDIINRMPSRQTGTHSSGGFRAT